MAQKNAPAAHGNESAQSHRKYTPQPLDNLLGRLERVKRVKSDQFVACCPAHDDSSPSLAIRDMGARVLVHCYAGCTFDEIRDALGMQAHEFFTDSNAPRPIVQGVTRRELAEALAIELLTAYVVWSDRAKGKRPNPDDDAREKLARQRITAAWRVAA